LNRPESLYLPLNVSVVNVHEREEPAFHSFLTCHHYNTQS
jgi:hypothetical protein